MRWKHDNKTGCQNMSQWPYMQQVVCRRIHVEGVGQHLCHWGLAGTQKSCCRSCVLTEFLNLAELHAMLKGVNLGLQWGTTKMHPFIDSHVSISWCLTHSIERPEKATNEMFTRRWLSTLEKLVKEDEQLMDVTFVKSGQIQAADRWVSHKKG